MTSFLMLLMAGTLESHGWIFFKFGLHSVTYLTLEKKYGMLILFLKNKAQSRSISKHIRYIDESHKHNIEWKNSGTKETWKTGKINFWCCKSG